MARIDVSTIEGYEAMTTEEKLAALEGMDLPEPDYTGYVRKDLLDRANSQAADMKKRLREKMSEEEQNAAQQAETLKSMQEELESLRREKAETEYAKRWMGVGYSEELAAETARAMAKGDMDAMFRNHAKFVAEREKALKAELLRDTPKPPAGNGSSANNWQRKIEEAQAAGDAVAVAYYMRMAALEAPR